MPQVWPLFNPHGFFSWARLSNCLLVGRFSNRNTLPRAAVLWSVHRYLGPKSRSHGSKLLLNSYRWPREGTQVQTRVNSWRVSRVSILSVSKKYCMCEKNEVIYLSFGQWWVCLSIATFDCNFPLPCLLRRHESKKLTNRPTNKYRKSGKRRKHEAFLKTFWTLPRWKQHTLGSSKEYQS